jgi:hypothetical protein
VLLTLYEGRGGRSVLVEGLPAIEALALFKPAWGWTYVGSGRSSTGVVILTCGTSDQNLSRSPAADGFIAARLVWIWKNKCVVAAQTMSMWLFLVGRYRRVVIRRRWHS